MNPYFKALFLAAAVAGLSAPATASADFRDYNYKAWAQAGRQRTSRSAMRSRPVYRSPAPVIVRTQPAPMAVAQAPTEERSFSYEPSQPTEARTYSYEPSLQSQTIEGTGCGDVVVTEQAPPTAERSVQTERSFSYEPAIEPATGPAVRTYRSFSYEPSMGGSYSAPRMQSSRPSRSSGTPRYLLPKTDPRKYRN